MIVLQHDTWFTTKFKENGRKKIETSNNSLETWTIPNFVSC